MSDTPAVNVGDFAVTSADGTATNAAGGTAGVPAGSATGTPPPAPPIQAPNQPAGDPPVQTMDQSAAIADLTARMARVEEIRASRPAPTLEQLQQQMDEVQGVKSEAIGAKVQARGVADSADEASLDVRMDIRKVFLSQAGVPDERLDFAAQHIRTIDGDSKQVVDALLRQEPWLTGKPAPQVPDVTQNQASNLEPGIAELAADIARRNPR